jgi:hypothetical protein
MKELCALMQGKEDDSRDNLYHELFGYYLPGCSHIPYSSYLVEQPAADKEETGQSQ